MPENLNQSEQDAAKVSISEVLSNRDPLPSAYSPYEDTPVPYIPQPSASPPQTSLQSEAFDTEEDTPRLVFPERKAGISGSGVVVGGVLGALLGSGLSLVAGGDMSQWAVIGALFGLFASAFSDRDWSRVFW
jgi:hypothetical protein